MDTVKYRKLKVVENTRNDLDKILILTLKITFFRDSFC